MSLADIAKRHREQKKQTSGLLKKTPKEKSALSLGELLKAKKEPKSTSTPFNLSSLIKKEKVVEEKPVEVVTKGVEKIQIKEKVPKT